MQIFSPNMACLLILFMMPCEERKFWILMKSVLVHLDCYKKIPWIEFINNKHLFHTVMEAGKSKIMVLDDLVFGEDCFLDVISHDRKDELILCGLSYNPSYEGSALWPNNLPVTPAPKCYHVGVEISTYEIWEDTNVQTTDHNEV